MAKISLDFNGLKYVRNTSPKASNWCQALTNFGEVFRRRKLINIPTLVTRRPSSKAREGRMASHSTDEQRSWPGCMGGLGVPLELGCLLVYGALVPDRPPITNCMKELRQKHDAMSQATLARKIGVSRQSIIAIEQGQYSPSLESAFRIARVFDVGIEVVFACNSYICNRYLIYQALCDQFDLKTCQRS